MKAYTKAYIPYKGYYSTPFSRWQGSMQNDNAVELGAATARRWFETKKFDPTILDYMYFGSTVAQNHWFVAHNYAAAMLTDDKKFVPALFVNQACATSTTILNLLAKDMELGVYEVGYGLMADRCSNGPHTIWPDPLGPGGMPDREDWNMDNFTGTPRHRAAMVQTAENVAAEIGITKDECDAVVLRRFQQYQEATDRLALVAARVVEDQRLLAQARQDLGVAQQNLSTLAVGMYKQSPTSVLDMFVGVGSLEDLATRVRLLDSVGRDTTQVLAEAQQRRDQMVQREAQTQADQLQARQLILQIAQQKQQLGASLTQNKAALGKANADVKRVAKEIVAERAQNGFERLADVISHDELVTIASLVDHYKGRDVSATAETFDSSPAAVEKRVQRASRRAG